MNFTELNQLINKIDTTSISEKRKEVLNVLAQFIQNKKDKKSPVNLNFICTHNSRRSHLSQIWAQTMASFFSIDNIFCYSGGTEATAMFPVVGKTLEKQGFSVKKISDGNNPVYSIKYAENHHPLVCFSKTFDHHFNPESNFAAIMTCSHADENCPFIIGAEARIAVRYDDPKTFDNTPQQLEKYEERSMQIATEMKYVFSSIK